MLPRTDTIHLTRVHARVAGDVFFPELDPAQWRETAVEHHAADERHQYAFTFVTLAENRAMTRYNCLDCPGLLLQPRAHRGQRLRHRSAWRGTSA